MLNMRKQQFDIGLFVSQGLIDIDFMKSRIKFLCRNSSKIHTPVVRGVNAKTLVPASKQLVLYKTLPVADGSNVRNGLIMWNAHRHLFFWDYSRDNTYEAILMAHRMSRKMKVYVDEGNGFYLLNKPTI